MTTIDIRFFFASDMGTALSLIGIVISLIGFFIGNRNKDKHIAFVVSLTAAILILLFFNRFDMNRKYIKIPKVSELTVELAKLRFVENGVDINHVTFHSADSYTLPEGVTCVTGVDPDENEIVESAAEITVFYEEGTKEGDNNSSYEPPRELIDAINMQLSDEGAALNEEDLRAFICMLNGDYSSISVDCLFRIIETFENIDTATVNRLAGIDGTDNHMTSVSAICDAFSGEKDTLFAEYWITRFEDLKRNIYSQEDMETVYREIDAFNADFYLAFCRWEPVQINGEEISVRALKKETVFFLQDMMVPMITQYLFNVHNGDSGQYIEMEEPSMGETVKISVGMIMEELTSRAEETRGEIIYNMQDSP